MVAKVWGHLSYALCQLGKATEGATGLSVDMYVRQYHSSQDGACQSGLLESFKKPDSVVRVVVCTIAFGLGVDIADIR